MEILFDRILVIALDESASSQASGCSIDSMTHQIQRLSQDLQINLLDRSTFYFFIDNEIQGIQMNDLTVLYKDGQVTDDTSVP